MKIFERGLFFAVYVARTLGAAPAVVFLTAVFAKGHLKKLVFDDFFRGAAVKNTMRVTEPRLAG